ncbi:MAG: NADH-quinone oxidoreductase subunit NuoH [Halobacteriovoraceae bacterium]|nr:NADH-quinone oxidoreductase subunit NuoH [Halobacteriovoraceae bacterium]
MNTTIAEYFLSFDVFRSFVSRISLWLGTDVTPFIVFMIFLLGALVITLVLATVGGFGTYAERKISADIQARIGPNRVGPYGLFQLIADGIKMVSKEDIAPKTADLFLFYLAPFLAIFGVFSTFAVIPFGSGITLTDLNVGVFYLVAISSLVGVGVFLGGYASNSKWSMLGGMRGASQIISYEIPVTLSILAMVLLSGGMSFGQIVGSQGAFPHQWFLFHNPFSFIAFFVLFTGALAETNRAPFDLPEAESELVSGYHTEYTGMRFGLFALAEYVEVFVVSGVAVSLFLGGYNVPGEEFGHSLAGQGAQATVFFLKTCALYYVVIWIRWTFPRLRVDQLMVICWKYLTPIAIFNLVGCAVWLVVFDGKSMFELFFHH